jgi:hypothetical protein
MKAKYFPGRLKPEARARKNRNARVRRAKLPCKTGKIRKKAKNGRMRCMFEVRAPRKSRSKKGIMAAMAAHAASLS